MWEGRGLGGDILLLLLLLLLLAKGMLGWRNETIRRNSLVRAASGADAKRESTRDDEGRYLSCTEVKEE